MEEKLEAIEYLEPPKRKHIGETYGGTVVIYRLKLMTRDQIRHYDLEKYVPEVGDKDEQRDLDA